MIVLARNEDTSAQSDGRVDDGHTEVGFPDLLAVGGVEGVDVAEPGCDVDCSLVLGNSATKTRRRVDTGVLSDRAERERVPEIGLALFSKIV